MEKRDDWKALRSVLSAEQLDGIDEDWRAFVERTGNADRDLFVQYLHQQGLIDDAQLVAALRIRIRPELSAIGALEQRARGEAGAQRTYAAMSPAGQFALLGQIGSGAMGEVWVGKDHDLKRKVAFKSLTDQFSDEPVIRQRFLSEAQITAQLDHPSVPPVYKLEINASGKLGYAMKLVEGQDLRELVQSERRRRDAGEPRRTSLADRLDLFLKVCEGVSYAHSRGVLHRDLKPDNIMVGRFGEAYVMDWGLARLIGVDEELADVSGSHDAGVTQAGRAVGTPSYMSPEQAQGRNAQLDARSDQYSLGLVLQELVTLERAVGAQTASEALRAAARAQRGDMSSAPRALQAIVARACARSPDQRYADVAALAADVRRYERDEPVDALREGPVRRLWRAMVRYRELALALGLGFVLIGSVAAVASVSLIGWSARVQQLREERLGQSIAAIGEQGHRIDKEVLRYERTLQVVAGAAGHLLAHAVPADHLVVFRSTDFAQASTAPADLAHSDRYGRAVSLTTPVFKLAPGVDPEDVRSDMAQLVRLHHDLERVVSGHASHGSPPVGWMYVGTEHGVHMSFPGHGGYTEDFDPRGRPWYRQATERAGAVWGNPYVDEGGLGLVVPCSRALRTSTGELLGVAGIDVTLGHVIDEMLAPAHLPISKAWLLDHEGRVMVMSDDREQEVHDPPLFPVPQVVTSVRATQPLSLRLGDGRWLLVFPLHALNWAYVVEASEADLVGETWGATR